MKSGIVWWVCLLAGVVCYPLTELEASPILDGPGLQVTLDLKDASLGVLDKRNGYTWRQQVAAGFAVEPASVQTTPGRMTAKILGGGKSYLVTLSLKPESPEAFDLALQIPGRPYTQKPPYPFPFTASGKDWSYVQNTSGEGMLMPLDKPRDIFKADGWSGSQPWWGLTDLHRAMSARLDSFRNPDSHTGDRDSTVYALPMRLHYSFFAEGGYVVLAKDYRKAFLQAHPEMKPLAQRVAARPALGNLKDGVYLYLWGNNPVDDLELVTEMKAAGIERGVAMFYGKTPVDRALFDGLKKLGWVPGVYRMPTGNLFHVSKLRDWPDQLLLGQLDRGHFYNSSLTQAWNRICGRHILPEWLPKAKSLLSDPGAQAAYFDTMVVQLAPCLDPAHPSTIEENQQARLVIMQQSRDLGLVIGSGEGLTPTWALPGLDFFEGEMSLRTYADPKLKIPAGDYRQDNGESYKADAAILLDETRRIPLYQLAFHDYVAGTWVWRDSNYQSTAFSHKKDLYNILYGTMPMWHIDRALWAAHKDDFVASYRATAAVRSRIGFAAMTEHGWLTPDRSVQYTDWDTGDRVIVNFGAQPFTRAGKPALAGGGFTIEKH